MNWRQAFIKQARSEHEVRQRLNDASVGYSHRLHYLQMVTEKLSKGMQIDPLSSEPPRTSHNAFVRLLQTLKGRPDIRKQLGYTDANIFRLFIDSLLDLADQIERLAPSAAGLTHANAEYPWWNPVSCEVFVPAEYDFTFFEPKSPRMVKLEGLLNALLRIAE